MHAFLALVGALATAVTLHAQKVDMKDMDASQEGTTTIEIKKGKKEDMKTENKWEVQDGTAEIEGESAATPKEAKAEWKKKCDEWKKEFRADNKDNKILSMSCGNANCGGEVGQKVCTSKATYKIKTQVN